MEKQELQTLRLFSPLFAKVYIKNEWGDTEFEPEEYSAAEILPYEEEILAAIEREKHPSESDRGLAVYLDNGTLKEKEHCINPSVEEWNGALWGVTEVQSYGRLAPAELSEVISELSGQFSDGWGDGVALFGSSIRHNDTIRLSISKGVLERHNNEDHHYTAAALKNQYVEVEMSYTQFAEAITSLNKGGGVPVAVLTANGQRMAPCPYENKQKLMRNEFKALTREVAQGIDQSTKQVADLLENKKTLSKADRDFILSTMHSVSINIRENIPFVNEMFAEQMDKTVTEAKGEFESFLRNKMNSIALAALAENQKKIMDQDYSKALPELAETAEPEETAEAEHQEEATEEEAQGFGMTMGMQGGNDGSI